MSTSEYAGVPDRAPTLLERLERLEEWRRSHEEQFDKAVAHIRHVDTRVDAILGSEPKVVEKGYDR